MFASLAAMEKRGTIARERAGSVRIIAGAWRSRRLKIPPGAAVRPTPDRVRETVFNWLRDAVEGAHCLDLFAGTGALGFEALSRGAAEAWLVERDPLLATALEQHAAALGARGAKLLRQDARALLRSKPVRRFDIVFCDPPYAEPLAPLLLALSPWLAAGALIYVERPRREGLAELPGFQWRKRGSAGEVEFGLVALAGSEA